MIRTMLALMLLGSSVWADECKLAKPVAIGPGNPGDRELVLTNAVFDQVPCWQDPKVYDPTKSTIDVTFDNVTYNDKPTGWLGVRAGIHGTYDDVGFGMDYGDDPSLKGAVQTQGSVTTYTLHEDEELSVNMGPTMADAITEEKIVIDNGNLVSLQLKIPVIHTDHVESDGSVILNFTGEHQTLCLQSAD